MDVRLSTDANLVHVDVCCDNARITDHYEWIGRRYVHAEFGRRARVLFNQMSVSACNEISIVDCHLPIKYNKMHVTHIDGIIQETTCDC